MKIIDGITMLKMIKDGTITNKTKLNCIDWVVSNSNNKVYVNRKGIVKWEVSNIPLTQEVLLEHHFEIIEEIPTIENLENRIENALEFLETQYGTFPNAEMWRSALKNILQGKNAEDVYNTFMEEDKKIEKIPITFQDKHNQTEINEYLRTIVNELIDEINKLKEKKEEQGD